MKLVILSLALFALDLGAVERRWPVHTLRKPKSLVRWQLECAGIEFAKERVIEEMSSNLRHADNGKALLSRYELQLNRYYKTLEEAMRLQAALSEGSENDRSPSSEIASDDLDEKMLEAERTVEKSREAAKRFDEVFKEYMRESERGKKRELSLSADYMHLKLRCAEPGPAYTVPTH